MPAFHSTSRTRWAGEEEQCQMVRAWGLHELKGMLNAKRKKDEWDDV
jgi:hypothetical protein